MTSGASSPPSRRFVTSSAFVDSASPGKNDVDSFFSASENFSTSFAWNETPTIAIQTSATIHLARRPATPAKNDPMGRGF